MAVITQRLHVGITPTRPTTNLSRSVARRPPRCRQQFNDNTPVSIKLTGGFASLFFPSLRRLAGHHVLQNTDDGGELGAGDAAADRLADQCTDIDVTGRALQHR